MQAQLLAQLQVRFYQHFNSASEGDGANEITWINGKQNCDAECTRVGGGPCPAVCGNRGYCCKRPEPGDSEIGSCPDIAKWSVLPVQDSKWRCVAPAGGPVDESIDENGDFDGENCILDSDFSILQHQFLLNGQSDFVFRSDEMTPRVCLLECLNQGLDILFYGLKGGTDCYCGEKLRYNMI